MKTLDLMKTHSQVKQAWGVILGVVAFAFPLLVYAYTGTFMRYAADDYCFNTVLAEHNFWEAQIYSYVHTTNYNSNRFSVMFFVALSELFGPTAIRALPTVFIALWVIGLTWGIKQIQDLITPNERANESRAWLSALLFAEMITFFTLYQAPDRFEILYWRSGAMTYLAPIIANIFLLSLLLKTTQLNRCPPAPKSKRAHIPVYALIFVMAFLTGGFSEAAIVVQTGYLGLLLMLLWARKKYAKSESSTFLLATHIAMLGTLLAFITQILSPSNGLRIQRYTTHPDIWSLTKTSIQFASDFVWFSARGLPIPSILAFLLAFTLAYFLHHAHAHLWPQLYRWGGGILATNFGLIFLSMLPSAYIQNAYPEARGLIIPRFIMVVSLMIAGFVSGAGVQVAMVRKPTLAKHLSLLLALLFIVSLLYPLRAAIQDSREIPQHLARAEIWDARDHYIHQASEAGVDDLIVPALDSIGVWELQPSPSSWVNRCAAQYYGLKTISAIEP